MLDDEPLAKLPDDFAGTVRLFPLPNLVMFPHAVHPLHIFEPRYREMLEAAVAGDHLLAMALLQPGWEPDYDGRPSVYPVTCVGRVMTHSRLDDGRYNILLLGLRRASILRELPDEQSYRCAEVAVLEDLYPAAGAAKRARLRRQLLDAFRGFIPESMLDQPQIVQLFSDQLPLGVLTDIVSFTLELELSRKQQLLSEWNVDARAELLLASLAGITGGARLSRPFPPDFSCN